MKTIVRAALALALLGGCGRRHAPAQSTTTAPAAASGATQPQHVMPDGTVMEGEHHHDGDHHAHEHEAGEQHDHPHEPGHHGHEHLADGGVATHGDHEHPGMGHEEHHHQLADGGTEAHHDHGHHHGHDKQGEHPRAAPDGGVAPGPQRGAH